MILGEISQISETEIFTSYNWATLVTASARQTTPAPS